MLKSLVSSMNDMMLLSMADVHVITTQSGYGTVAAMINPTSNHVIFRVPVNGERNETCVYSNRETLDDIGSLWSGI